MRCRICDTSTSGLSYYNTAHPFTTHFVVNNKDHSQDVCFACWSGSVAEEELDDAIDEDFDDE